MKHYLKLILLVILVIFGINKVRAAECSYKDQALLNKEASNVKITYQLIEDEEEEYLQILITNLNEHLTLEISNDYNDEIMNFSISDAKEGVISFKNIALYKMVTYKINIYGAYNSCSRNLIMTKNISIPYFNIFYDGSVCKNIPDYTYCQKLVKTNMSAEDMAKKINDYYQKQVAPKEEKKEVKTSWVKIVLLIVLGIFGLVLVALIVLIGIKRRNKNVKKK